MSFTAQMVSARHVRMTQVQLLVGERTRFPIRVGCAVSCTKSDLRTARCAGAW